MAGVRVNSASLVAGRESRVASRESRVASRESLLRARRMSPPSRRTPSRSQHTHSPINYSRRTLTKQPFAALTYTPYSFFFRRTHFMRNARPTSRRTVNSAYSHVNLLAFRTAHAKSLRRAVVIYSFLIISCCPSAVTQCIINSA